MSLCSDYWTPKPEDWSVWLIFGFWAVAACRLAAAPHPVTVYIPDQSRVYLGTPYPTRTRVWYKVGLFGQKTHKPKTDCVFFYGYG